MLLTPEFNAAAIPIEAEIIPVANKTIVTPNVLF